MSAPEPPQSQVGDAVGNNGAVADLLAQRERLTERFALMQSELGGLFYEMAIRDHIELDVLAAKAAGLQRIDLQLAELERHLEP